MSRYNYLAVFSAVLVLSGCQTPPKNSPTGYSKEILVGTWVGIDSDRKSGEAMFYADGRMVFLVDGMKLGVPTNKNSPTATYSVETTTNPWHLNVMVAKEGKTVGVLRGLLSVADEKTIRIGFDTTKQYTETYPASFSSLRAEDVIEFKKASSVPREVPLQPDVITRPSVIKRSRPVYPAELKKNKVEGHVTVEFTVTAEGKVVNPRVIESTHQAFVKPSIDAVLTFEFHPGTKNGVPRDVKMRIPIMFSANPPQAEAPESPAKTPQP